MNPLRDQFAYLLTDDVDGDAVASVTVTLTVVGADRVPPALDDSFTILEKDTAVVLTVMANDDLGDPSYSVVNAGVGFKDPEEDGIWVICDPPQWPQIQTAQEKQIPARRYSMVLPA